MAFLSEMDPQTGLLEAEAVREKGSDLEAVYNAANPFPHVMINDFLPRNIIDMCLAEFDRGRNDEQKVYNRSQERLKREFKPDQMSEKPRNLFYTFNSRPFIKIIENITGIKGLIPDPYYLGAGFHEVHNGGHLSIHADFNHHRMMNLERRINVLIYLNDDWKAEYGGSLELWDNEMTGPVESFVPIANRCIIFNTTSNSNHGNPALVNHPSGLSRKSIALYYYTSTWADDKLSHGTHFRVRPKSNDKTDYRLKAFELVKDLAPPMIWRAAMRTGRAVVGRKGDH